MALTTKIKAGPESSQIDWKNTTGSSVSIGAIVKVGRRYGRLFSSANGNASAAAVAANEYGVVDMAGIFKVPKVTATAYAVGDEVIWSATNSKVYAAGTRGKGWQVVEAAVNGDTTVLVRFNDNIHTWGTEYTTDATDNSNNYATIDTGLGATPTGLVTARISTAAGVHRMPQGVVEWLLTSDLGKIKISDSGLAASEIVTVTAEVI